ncbi:MAG: NADH-quinone oxidoreductase subunit [Bacteroidetes bacterium]|nr:NADH-quinone oxidoreductase subunit [Bacteroidota bacterium]
MSLLLAVAFLGVLCLVLEILNLKKTIVPVVVIALLGLFGVTVNDLLTHGSLLDIVSLPGMLVFNNYAKAFSALFVLLTSLILCLIPFCTRERTGHYTDYTAIILFLLSGAIAMVSFSNLSMFFIGLEVLSISLYLLSASNVKSKRSNEAGMKYFLMGSFASSIILFGVALIYGATGTFDISKIIEITHASTLPIWYSLGLTLILVGMLFKVSAAPFHFWAPDVYQGAPTIITTVMSTLVKVAAVATLYKLMDILVPSISEPSRIIILVISILTMTIGNITAIKQTNIKRLLAFSGISHAGFMLMALLYLHQNAEILLYYTVAYSLAGVAAFSVVIAVCHAKGKQDLEMFSGLGKTNPLMAVVLTGAMFSMAGIPIFSGFMAKLFLFNEMLAIGEIGLVVVGVLNSIVSVFYYFRVVNLMFTKEPDTSHVIKFPIEVAFVAVVAIVLNILLGLYPSIITSLTL